MSSVQKCTDQLREQAYKTLTPQIQALEDELRNFNKLLADGIRSVGYKLEVLRNTELPATESILGDYLQDAIRKRDIEGEMLAIFMRGLRTKETQEEILDSLLDNAVNCFPRVALFAVRGDMFKGWSSRGFSDYTAGTISLDEFRQADCSLLLEALRNGYQAKSADLPDIGSLRLLRDELQGVWRLYPLHVLDRPVAILLAGEAEDFAGRPEALAVLMDCVALRLENVALKIMKTLNESASSKADADVSAAKPLFNVPSHQATSGMSCNVLSLNLTASIKTPEPVESVSESYYEPDAARPNPLAGLKLAEQLPEPVLEIPAIAASEHTQEAADDTESTATDTPAVAAYEYEEETFVETYPTVVQPDVPTSPPPAINPEDERLHVAAKRFAELLVTEIMFFNEDAVAEGRKNHDLFMRLHKSMNRIREMYEKRVAPTVAQRIDYLHEEFVRILGDGNAEVFGDDYPGPLSGRQTGL